MAGRAVQIGLVVRADFAHDHAQRPAIRDDVVDGEVEVVGFRGALDEQRPQQWSLRQVKWFLILAMGQVLLLGVLLIGREMAQVGVGDGEGECRHDPLPRLPIMNGKNGAQRFVSPDQVVQAVFQRGHMQRTVQGDGGGDVVEWVCRHQSMQKPEAFLCKRKRQWRISSSVGQRRRFRCRWCLPQVAYTFGEGGDVLGVKQGLQRQINLERLLRPGDDARRQEGMAAQFPEVVVDADALLLQAFRPDAGHCFFVGGAWWRVGVGCLGWCGRGRGEGVAVDFAVGGEGKCRHHHKSGRDHGRWQRLLQEVAQLARRRAGRRGRNEISDQLFFPGGAISPEQGALPHPRMRVQAVLNFPQFHAHAIYFHLVIQSP